jgi:hypothetical protein
LGRRGGGDALFCFCLLLLFLLLFGIFCFGFFLGFKRVLLDFLDFLDFLSNRPWL